MGLPVASGSQLMVSSSRVAGITLAFVIDQPHQSIKIYYNGTEAPLSFVSDEGFTQGQFSYSFNTAGPFTIGAFPGGMNYNFKGHLDDMRVYNRILSPEEIAKIAQEK